MNEGIEKILSGEVIPTFKPFDYSTKKGQKIIKDILNEQKKIDEINNVDWAKLNKFKINI